MISRHIDREPQNDHYGRLANYIADAGHEGEKALMSWCAGCWAGDDYELAIQEVEDTQDLNSRTTREKTYHLIVSFRPEDEARLTPEIFKEIETSFALALGLEEHQRHCGVHKNTNNLHMHIAYNLIHPETLTRHEPYRDFHTRDRLCRDLEKKYGLVIDNGRDQKKERETLSPGAATLEAHTGQQSFETYAKGHRAAILTSLAGATGWQGLHEALAAYGMEIKPHANGLAVKDRHGRHAVKASALDRSLSLKRLEAQLGPFEAAKDLDQAKEQCRYQAAPLHRGPERGQLYAEYQAGIAERKSRLNAVKEQEEAVVEPIRAKWAAKRLEIQRMDLPGRSKSKLIKLARPHEAEALAKARQDFAAEKSAVKKDIPFSAWAGFLQGKAGQGDNVALAILRSGKEEVPPEQDPAEENTRAKLQGVRVEYLGKEREILEAAELQAKSKKGLLSVLTMERLAAEDAAKGSAGVFAGATHSIDKRGNVIFTLASGGLIRDTTKGIFFSAHDKAAQEAALRFAQAKWGKGITLEGNQIRQTLARERQKQRGGIEAARNPHHTRQPDPRY